jgi:hypothetical protein
LLNLKCIRAVYFNINLSSMSTISYEELFQTLKYEIDNLSRMLVQDYYNEGKSDGYYMLAELRNNIEDWCEMLETGDIDDGNFKSLLFEESDNFKMMALRKAGLTIQEIEDFKNAVFKLIYSTIITLVKQP